MAYRFLNQAEALGSGSYFDSEELKGAIARLPRNASGWIVRSGAERRFLCLG
jgi:hypothetical protein